MFGERVGANEKVIFTGIIVMIISVIGFILAIVEGYSWACFLAVIGFIIGLVMIIFQVSAEKTADQCRTYGSLKEATITDIKEVSTGRYPWMVDHHMVVSFTGEDGMTHESEFVVDSDTAHSYAIGMKIMVNVYHNHASL